MFKYVYEYCGNISVLNVLVFNFLNTFLCDCESTTLSFEAILPFACFEST